MKMRKSDENSYVDIKRTLEQRKTMQLLFLGLLALDLAVLGLLLGSISSISSNILLRALLATLFQRQEASPQWWYRQKGGDRTLSRGAPRGG